MSNPQDPLDETAERCTECLKLIDEGDAVECAYGFWFCNQHEHLQFHNGERCPTEVDRIEQTYVAYQIALLERQFAETPDRRQVGLFHPDAL